MLKTLAIVTGSIFLLIGILGFIPATAPDGHLLGIFHVNVMHNIVHLVSGLAALACGLLSEKASRAFFAIFGVIYGLVAILGFLMGEGMLLGLIAINTADNWLHLIIALVALYLG